MFISHSIEFNRWIITDSDFIEIIHEDIYGIAWGPFACKVAKIYQKKNLPVAKNIARLLGSNLRSQTSALKNARELSDTDFKKYLTCIEREIYLA